jgi:hypothetical protein
VIPIHIAAGKAGVSIAVTRGTQYVHTTRIYMLPYEFVVAVVAVVAFLIWMACRRYKTSK